MEQLRRGFVERGRWQRMLKSPAEDKIEIVAPNHRAHAINVRNIRADFMAVSIAGLRLRDTVEQ